MAAGLGRGVGRGLFGAIADGLERKTADVSALTWARLLGEAATVKSGVAVNIDSALRTTTVLACGRVIAEGVAQLPFKLYREAEDGSRVPARDQKLYRLLWRQPNDWMTSFEFRETLTLHAVFTGGGFAIQNHTSQGLAELLPVMPGNMTVRRDRDWGLRYVVRDADGVIGEFAPDRILHLRGPSWNGFTGLDIVQTARDAIGLAIATEETHARLHANGAQPGGIISMEGKLAKDGRERIKEAFQQTHAGVQNRFRTMVLDQNAKWHPLAMTGVDSQHLETRRFQIEEVCRALKVFPQMVGYADKTATFASAEAFFTAHVIYTLQPWLERWEQVVARDLIDPAADDLYAKFSVQGLLRGDAAARAEYYASGIVNGWLTRNDARRLEDMNPLLGLDEPLVPLNMGTRAERDAAAKEITEAVKSALIGHNGGPSLDDDAAEQLEQKIGRVLSAQNEGRIKRARGELDQVLRSLPPAKNRRNGDPGGSPTGDRPFDPGSLDDDAAAKGRPDQPRDELGRFAAVGAALVDFARRALRRGKLSGFAKIGGVMNAQAVRDATGIDLAGYRRIVDGSAVRHALAQHGDAEAERRRGQIAVTVDDFRRIPEIVARPDQIQHGGRNKLGRSLARYVRTLDAVEFTYVEETRTGARHAAMVTLWKRGRKA